MNVVGRGEADGTGADIGATDEELTELVAEATALTAARAAFCAFFSAAEVDRSSSRPTILG
jgi:hypothetical protein